MNEFPSVDMSAPQGDEAVEAAGEIGLQAAMIDNARSVLRGDGDNDPTKVGIPEIDRALNEEKLERMHKYGDPIQKRKERNLEIIRSERAGLGVFGRIREAVLNATNQETLEQEENGNIFQIEEIAEQFRKQEEVVAVLQEVIMNDPHMQKEVVAKAKAEAAIIKRLALSYAIKENLGSEVLGNDESIKRLVELHNEGKLPIQARHLDLAEVAYDMLAFRLKGRVFGAMPGSFKAQTAANEFFNPMYQLKVANQNSLQR